MCNCNESIFTDSCTYQTFFYNKECKDKQNIRKDKFYFSCGKINKYDHLQHIFQIHFHKMRQIIVYDNSISTCMGNFKKNRIFFSNNVMVCNILYCIHQKIKKNRTRIKFG